MCYHQNVPYHKQPKISCYNLQLFYLQRGREWKRYDQTTHKEEISASGTEEHTQDKNETE